MKCILVICRMCVPVVYEKYIYAIILHLYKDYQKMSQNHKNGQATQTSNVTTARLLGVKMVLTMRPNMKSLCHYKPVIKSSHAGGGPGMLNPSGA